ncbi:hypothetical protein HK097_002351 [Rhizophlyctis rosea]|uniref:2,5-diamino-6-ribosylamino-4(3H)-pyrimidinone 5'-phosphate reductase n=1 Tax=Rhizophlyctis rosea TaxID=64517 RepID=A0AAD5X396_9FUNG|nr:hypothetical protein HK097_002351 [Rhizophlyctis rosea]
MFGCPHIFPHEPHSLKRAKSGTPSIDFKDAKALRELTYAILWADFQLRLQIPLATLCPPIPNRLDYILWLEDLIGSSGPVRGIDIGTGASCIYPLLGARKNTLWEFVATDVDPRSVNYAQENVSRNDLGDRIKVLQSTGVLLLPDELFSEDTFDFCMCNPPFYESEEQVAAAKEAKALDSFAVCSGTKSEMITEGGEYQFILRLIDESMGRKDHIRWFTSLLGRKEDAEKLSETLASRKIRFVLDELRQAKTVRWVIAWTFEETKGNRKHNGPPLERETIKRAAIEDKGNGGSTVANLRHCPHLLTLRITVVVELKQSSVRAIQEGRDEPFEYEVRREKWTPQQFLLAYPSGAYTVARTINGSSVVSLSRHVARMYDTLCGISFNRHREKLDEEGASVSEVKLAKKEHTPVREALGSFRDQSVCEKICEKMLRKAIAEFYHVSEDARMEEVSLAASGREAMAMVFVTYSHKTQEVNVVSYCAGLPPRRSAPLHVCVYGPRRGNPEVKDSIWVRMRRPIEAVKPADVAEMLLTDKDGNIYEGLRTNFCVVVKEPDGRYVVISASKDSILMGTMLSLVEAACKRKGIEFRFEFPKSSDRHRWVGAFLLSVNNVVTPIESIRFGLIGLVAFFIEPLMCSALPDHRSHPILLPQDCPLVRELSKAVWGEMEREAAPIFNDPADNHQPPRPTILERGAYSFIMPILSRSQSELLDRPAITLTFAQSLDGFIAGPNKTPLLISSPESMVMTHALRCMHDAILVGISTVLADDPSLSCRNVQFGPDGVSPVRHPRPIILDSRLRCPIPAKFMGRNSIIVTTKGHDEEERKKLEGAGAEVLVVEEDAVVEGRIRLEKILGILKGEPWNVGSIMIEGGASVIGYCLGERDMPVDNLIVTVAPMVVGEGVRSVEEGRVMPKLVEVGWKQFGRDAVMSAKVQK